ncbi:TatD family hydrolase [Nitrosopumilus sp.]|uniref:TatD family hydrolase n=1 Tax=Nitrosopumilus sp. TaxID=2024843 RepID=UPI0026141B03|nr:TatD family hydrolase [Nitrosopumilus sp.]
MTWYFDSHIHLSDPQYAPEIDYILKQMEILKMKACCVSMDYENSLETLNLARTSNHVLPFIGIHPECSNDNLESVITLIEENHEIISGIGEIGLDPNYITNDDFSRQIKVFETLLSLAEKYKKPVSIHSRKSLDKIFELMTSFDTSRSLLHWFDGSKKNLSIAMDMGFYVSYGPVMIYANDKQTLLSKTDLTKILVETDGPVRFSRCFEMKSGQISFIPSVIFCAAKILGKSFDEMSSILEKNSKSYLGI